MKKAFWMLSFAVAMLCGCATTAPATPVVSAALLGGDMVSALKSGNREEFSKHLAPELKEQMTKAAVELMKSTLAQLGDSIDRAEYITSL
ncbi:MAG: hypothetical protein MJ025_06065, partial [Victivallaceae bacterium]|nr:hypothetical protein [Victivallaceae bacterium]